MRSFLETHWRQLIESQEPSFFKKVALSGLDLASKAYGCTVQGRNRCFDKGWMKSIRLPCPVISIGNLALGGTGKTPLTLHLAKTLSHSNKVAILSRGYRSRAEHRAQPLLLSRGEGPLCSWEEGGDEPYLLAARLPGVLVLVGSDRVAAAQMALTEGAELLILDDGLQHRKVERDLDIVILNHNNPFGKGHLFPRGILREGPEALSRAHCIVMMHTDAIDAGLRTQIARYSQAPLIAARMRCSAIRDLRGNDWGSIRGRRVALFCGIANPYHFVQTVVDLGANVVSDYFIEDHGSFKEKNFIDFANRSRIEGAEILLCTEKDRVKLSPHLETSLPIGWVEIELLLGEGREAWENLKFSFQRF